MFSLGLRWRNILVVLAGIFLFLFIARFLPGLFWLAPIMPYAAYFMAGLVAGFAAGRISKGNELIHAVISGVFSVLGPLLIVSLIARAFDPVIPILHLLFLITTAFLSLLLGAYIARSYRLKQEKRL